MGRKSDYERLREQVVKQQRAKFRELQDENMRLRDLYMEQEQTIKELRQEIAKLKSEQGSVKTPIGTIGAMGVGRSIDLADTMLKLMKDMKENTVIDV